MHSNNLGLSIGYLGGWGNESKGKVKSEQQSLSSPVFSSYPQCLGGVVSLKSRK